MYSIVLTNGKTINVKANNAEWCQKDRMVKLFNDKVIVARINMDNVVGWINTNYMEENDEKGGIEK